MTNESCCPQVNIGKAERWLSIGAGAALTLMGLRRCSLSGLMMAAGGGYLIYRGNSGRCGLYRALGNPEMPELSIQTEQQVTVQRSREDVEAFCRNPANWNRFVEGMDRAALDPMGSRESGAFQCNVELPGGIVETIEATLIEDHPRESMVWRIQSNRLGEAVCRIFFHDAPANRGTVVGVACDVFPPGGLIGRSIAQIMRPLLSQRLREDLRRFQRVMETGEIITTEGQPSGREGRVMSELRAVQETDTAAATCATREFDELDEVAEASDESFPASDAPAWTSTRSGG